MVIVGVTIVWKLPIITFVRIVATDFLSLSIVTEVTIVRIVPIVRVGNNVTIATNGLTIMPEVPMIGVIAILAGATILALVRVVGKFSG
jgi:hypothetical protein